MLQIATGKLFSRPVRLENQLRGVLHTNAILHREGVDTAAGKLLAASDSSLKPQAVVYELIERIETEAYGPPLLVSSGVEPYLRDFAVVASFALNCTFSPSLDLTRRLTGGERGVATRLAPSRFVRRFFDPDVFLKPEELQFFASFTQQLIGLRRETFLGVMRALRTYVAGMHRIADDLELAYTLLVASVESLAQKFDGHQSVWDSVDDKKRRVFDKALEGADAEVAQRVREAFLSVEHVALRRRFAEFTTAHLTPGFFRSSLAEADRPVGRSELAEVLGLAYKTRSSYVHELLKLPDELRMGHGFAETAIVGRETHLTLQGLSRMMRAAIIEFVQRQPVVAQEPHDYLLERSGVVRVRWAPEMWVWRADGDITAQGRDKLEGFTDQLATHLSRVEGATVSDMRDVLTAAATFVSTIERRLRRPYLALHAAWNRYVTPQEQAPTPAQLQAFLDEELNLPCAESLFAHAIYEQVVDWPIEQHRRELETYLRRRGAKNGLRLPRLFEAAMTLDLAERYRVSGNMQLCSQMVALAVENHAGHARLRELEGQLQPDQPIRWQTVLLAPPPQAEPAAAAAAVEN